MSGDPRNGSEDGPNGGSVTPTGGQGADVFISYGHADLAIARELRGLLEAGGNRCWLAPDDVTGPSAWADQLVAAIRDCRVMLILISADSIASDHVSKEVDLAVEYGKLLLPVRIEDIMPSGTLRYLLGLAQWIDAFPGPIESHSGEVVRRVSALLADLPTGEPYPSDSADRISVRRPAPSAGWGVRGRFRWSVLAAVGLVAAGLSIGVIWFSGASTSSDTSTVTTEVAAPTTTTPAVEGPTGTVLEELWSLDLDAPVVGMATMDGLVVIATDDGLVRGVAVGSGEELWTHQADLPAQHGVFTDNGVIYYATVEGVHLLDPATGGLLDGCGFSYRGEAHGVAVEDGSVYFVLAVDGTVRRVPTNPFGDGPCHDPAFESVEAAQWPPVQSGPVVIGSEVMVGDSRRLSRYDTSSLELLDSYYLAAGTDETYDGRVVGLAGLERRTQQESGVRVQVAVYGVDAENSLYTMSGTRMVAAGVEAAMVPVVSPSAVYLVDASGMLGAWSHDLDDRHWTLQLDTQPTGLWLANDTVYVTLADGKVTGLDIEHGAEVHRFKADTAVEMLESSSGVLILVDGTERIVALPTTERAASTPPAMESVPRPTPIDAETVARDFYAAIAAGNSNRVSDLIAVDAVLLASGFGGGEYWYSSDTRDYFWSQVDFFEALNVELLIGQCERTEAGISVQLNCEVTQTDDYLKALNTQIEGVARLTVESGLIHVFRAQRPVGDDYLPIVELSGRRGLSFEHESELLYQNFFRWSESALPDAAKLACGDIQQPLVTPECAQFMLDHVEEYLAASQ